MKLKRYHRNKFSSTWKLYEEVPLQSNGERIVFSVTDNGKMGYTYGKQYSLTLPEIVYKHHF